jgi:hypothetical protein
MIHSKLFAARSEAEDLRPPPRWLAIVETAILTGGIVLLGYALHPDDPFFLKSPFVWCAAAPLLVGLRYGFVYGFGSALALTLGIAVSWKTHLLSIETFPAHFVAGLVVFGMLAGEFSDMWTRRLRRFGITGGYLQMRLEEFTRAYHVLKISHDRLEQRLAGSAVSLREALMTTRRQLLYSSDAPPPVFGLENRILKLFADYGSVQVASLYLVEDGRLAALPLAQLGSGVVVSGDDPVIRKVFETRHLITIRDSAVFHDGTSLLAAVPISDMSDHIWAIVAIRDIPLVAFTQKTLQTLGVIAGHIGDLLAFGPAKSATDEPASMEFVQHLARGIEDCRNYDLPTVFLAMTLDSSDRAEEVERLILDQRRRLDQLMLITNTAKQRVFLMLMPLTDASGASSYLVRIDGLLKSRLGVTSQQVKLVGQQYLLTKNDDPEELLTRTQARLLIKSSTDARLRAAS